MRVPIYQYSRVLLQRRSDLLWGWNIPLQRSRENILFTNIWVKSHGDHYGRKRERRRQESMKEGGTVLKTTYISFRKFRSYFNEVMPRRLRRLMRIMYIFRISLFRVVKYITVQYSPAQNGALQCSAVQCSAMQCSEEVQ